MSEGSVAGAPRRWGLSGPYLPVVIFFLVAAVLALTARTGYEISLITTACINVIVLAGLNLIAGYGGQLALGQAAFVGVGAYASVILVVDLGVPSVVALIVSPFVSALLAVLIGLPSLRLRGLYFAVATLAFGVILNQVLLQGGALTGGPDGRGSGMAPLDLFGLVLDNEYYRVAVAAVLAALSLLATRALSRTWFGWALQASKVSEPATAGIGADVFRTRLGAFVLSGAFGGLGGSLLAFEQLYVSPSSFTFFSSIDFFMVLFLGGLGTFLGPIIGAVILYVFARWLSGLPDAQPFILGLIFLAALRFFPRGVAGWIQTLSRRARGRRARSGAGSEEDAPAIVGLSADRADSETANV